MTARTSYPKPPCTLASSASDVASAIWAVLTLDCLWRVAARAGAGGYIYIRAVYGSSLFMASLRLRHMIHTTCTCCYMFTCTCCCHVVVHVVHVTCVVGNTQSQITVVSVQYGKSYGLARRSISAYCDLAWQQPSALRHAGASWRGGWRWRWRWRLRPAGWRAFLWPKTPTRLSEFSGSRSRLRTPALSGPRPTEKGRGLRPPPRPR